MSKWFRTSVNEDDDDDSEESSEAEESEEEDEDEESEEDKETEKPRASRFLKSANRDDDDDDDDDESRQKRVMSQREKRNLEVSECEHDLKQQFQDEDFPAIAATFERLSKVADRASVPMPKALRKALLSVDAFVREHDDKEELKSRPAADSKAFLLLKQRVRKTLAKYGVNEGEEEATIGSVDAQEKQRAEEQEKEWKPELIEKKKAEALANRGSRKDRKLFVYQMESILAHTKFPHLQVQLLVYLVSGYLETPSSAAHVRLRSWKIAHAHFMRILNIMAEHPNFVLSEVLDEDIKETPSGKEDANTVKIQIDGKLLFFMERFDEEFTKALQLIDPHTREFAQWLSCELHVVDACERVYHFYRSRDMMKHSARLAARLLDHLYFRRQHEHVKMLARQREQSTAEKKKKRKKKLGEDGEPVPVVEEKKATPNWWFISPNLTETLTKLITAIQRHGDDKAKARALLCRVFHLAVHDHFAQARDIVLMSKIHEVVGVAAHSFQVLFNRVLAQLGLAAFRLGRWHDVHVALNDLCASQRHKELLAQGLPMQRYQDRKVEIDKTDRLKLVPYHMHINLELLEACHLVAALFLEIPMMAANEFEINRKIQSKAFHKLLNFYQALYFLGPPENTRDHVYAATQALLKGDWVTANNEIVNLTVWDSIPAADKMRETLTRTIKETALRTYLLQYSSLYSTLSLPELAQKFDLPTTTVHSLVSKMISTEEVSGSWDEPAAAIRMHNAHPTKLQYLCLLLSDKTQALVENNERILDARSGGFGTFGKMGQDKGNRQQDGMWGNNNRWAVFGGGSQPGGLLKKQQQQQQTGGNRQGNFNQGGQQRQKGFGMQNKQQGNNRFF